MSLWPLLTGKSREHPNPAVWLVLSHFSLSTFPVRGLRVLRLMEEKAGRGRKPRGTRHRFPRGIHTTQPRSPNTACWPFLSRHSRPHLPDCELLPLRSGSFRHFSSLHTGCRCPFEWRLCRSQRDQEYTNDPKQNHRAQKFSASARSLECHDHHNSGMSKTRPCREPDQASIRRWVAR